MKAHGWLLLTCSMLAAWPFAPVVLADGMVFRKPVAGEAQTVEVGLQRGLIWRSHDALEVWIEPVYAWKGDDTGAWVIPLPALPDVAEGDAKVLDDLDALTAPTFVSVCWEPDCSQSCGWLGCLGGGTSASGKGGDRTGEAESRGSAVTVWSSGSVGALDYEVISATDGDGAVAWLTAHGYAVGDGAAQALATLDTEGLFFFVAHVAAPREAGQSLAPVRFVFAPTVRPFYPVRLTAAALAADTHLDVTLWLLSDERLLPKGEDAVLAFSNFPTTWTLDPEGYAASLEHKFEGMPDGGFVVEYAGALSESRLFGTDGAVQPTDCEVAAIHGTPQGCADAWGTPWCNEGYCGTLDPLTLTSNLKQRVRDAETPYTVRLRGRLPAGTRETEWRFAATTEWETWELDRVSGVYAEDRGDCYECPPPAGLLCQPAATRPNAPGPALLIALGGVAIAAFARRRAVRPSSLRG